VEPEEVMPTPAPQTEEGETKSEEGTAPEALTPTPTITSTSTHRPPPASITRPARNFAEIEECKRTPSYLSHGITLSTAVKAHPVQGAEAEAQPADSGMQALF
jgi:hypothetical protein